MAISAYLYCFIIFAVSCTSVRSELKPNRLSSDITPSYYDLNLEIDPMNKSGFTGIVKITCRTSRNTDKIVLHSASNLEIKDILINTTNRTIYGTWDYTSEYDFLTINLNDSIETGMDFSVDILFSGRYRDIQGLFRREYKNSKEENEGFVGSNFEMASARNGFPCFDEPTFKSKFMVTVRHPYEYLVLSNMDVENAVEFTKENRKWKTTKFKVTPRMSTSSLGIFVMKLESISNVKEDNLIYNKPTEVYAHSDYLKRSKFILEIAQKCMVALEKYLDVEFGMPKLTIVLLPKRYMKNQIINNWGIIALEGQSLLRYIKNHDVKHDRTLINHISQAVSKMWFGNEVTVNWWDSIWIVTGLASYFSFKLPEMIHGDERYLSEDMMIKIMLSTEYSTYLGTRILKYDRDNYNRDDSAYLSRYYQMKAAAIVRMFAETIGETQFKLAMRNFIKNNSGIRGTFTSEDLLKELRLSSNLNLPNGAIEMWADHCGLPIIEVIQRKDSPVLDLYQQQWCQSQNLSNENWYVPLTWNTEFDATKTGDVKWLNPDKNHTIELKNDDECIILNKKMMGYYRTQYDIKNWKKITQVLQRENFGGVDPITRAMLIINSDTSKSKNFSVILNILKYLKNETEYLPWFAAHRTIRRFNYRTHQLKYYNRLKTFIGSLIEPRLKAIKETVEKSTNNLNDIILDIGRTIDSELAKESANNVLDRLIDNPAADIANFESLNMAMERSNERQRNYVFQRYLNETDELIKRRIFNSLIKSDDEFWLKRLYSMMLNNETTQNQINGTVMIKYLTQSSPAVLKYLSDFTIENFEDLYSIYGIETMESFLYHYSSDGFKYTNLRPSKEMFVGLFNKYKNSSTISMEMLTYIEEELKKFDNPRNDEPIDENVQNLDKVLSEEFNV